jgi:hypothetical protein
VFHVILTVSHNCCPKQPEANARYSGRGRCVFETKDSIQMIRNSDVSVVKL